MHEHVWHALPVAEAAKALETDIENGLSRTEADARLKKGRNELPPPRRDTMLGRFLRQFASPIALILLFAAAATFFLSHYTDVLVIAVALLVNVIMGMVQEGRASKAFETLQKGEARFAVVIRNGEPLKIAAECVVPGDVLVLMNGSAIPADVRLIETRSLLVNEAALSGEWVPVEKDTKEAAEDAPLVTHTGMGYAGTLIVGGTGKGVAVRTGPYTEIGKIAAELHKERNIVTPLMRDVRTIARFLVGIVVVIALGIGVLGLLRGLSLDETLFTAIALAVASVPEGLPAAVTVVLALGMERILRQGGLVRNLRAAETLGTTSIVLTDKTGTLTFGRMSIDSFVTHAGRFTDPESEDARMLLSAGVIASDAYIEERAEGVGDEKLVAHGRPVEQAIVLAGLKAGISAKELFAERPVKDELAFDSSRRFAGKLVHEGAKGVAYVTGAPELFLASAHEVRDASGDVHRLVEGARKHFEDALSAAAKEGKRVLALMRVPHAGTAFPKEDAASMLDGGELLGLIVFADGLRPDVKEAIRDIQGAGARVLMLTGDNPETALAIAREVGIAGPHERAYTGSELARLSDEELVKVLREHHVFARVAPAEKLRIANVLVGAGEVIAMTGDGVNDAPALSAATIGVAVGSGTDVAKEASDIVLLNDGFGIITSAIREGRRLRDNLKKIFAYMLSTNFSEVILISFSLIAGMPLPILPTQILWSNLIEGGLMNFAFAFEPLYPSAMKRKPTDPDIAQVFSHKVVKLIALTGTVTAASLIAIYLFLVQHGFPEAEIQTYMFIGVSVNCIFMAFSMKSFGTPIWRMPLFSNLFLLIALAASALMLLAALYVPALQALVHTVPPTLPHLAVFVGFGIFNLFTIEIGKWLFFIHADHARRKRGLQAA